MHVRKIDPKTFVESYGTSVQYIFPCEESGKTPFTASWCHVEPGGASVIHRHHEGETFIIMRGSGVMTVGEESQPVEAGDVIFMEPLVDHTIRNTSETEQIVFLDIYWEDTKLLLKDSPPEASARGTRTIAYPSPPNPNGDLHLGHLAGPVMSADVYVRHRRQLGDPAYFVIGTDDNQIWTAGMAERRGTTPQETADHFAAEIAETMRRAKIDCAHLYRPNATPQTTRIVTEVLTRLHADGHLVARDAPALWCETCDLYLFELRVKGLCPHCGRPSCGNACEDCGRPNQVVDMGDPVCTRCGKTPVERPVRRLFFPLEPHREAILAYHRKTAMTSHHRALCHRMLEDELPEVVASHPCDWGLPVPLPGFEGQVISAWIEMAPGYLAAGAGLAETLGLDGGWRAFWAGENTRVVQFFGFDNCWNHGILYPALLRAYDAELRLPEAFVANHLYRLDGEKFSTSRGHAVWARDLVAMNSPDTVRFFSAYNAPEVEPTSFSLSAFAAFTRDELIGRWQPWLRSIQAKIDERYADGVPEAGAWTDGHLVFLKRLKSLIGGARLAYAADSFSPQSAARLACELVYSARRFATAQDAWNMPASAHNERRTCIALELAAVRTLAMIVTPVMPDFAACLWKSLGYATALETWYDDPQLVDKGNRVSGLDAEFFPPPVIERQEQQQAAVA